jgi:hypothetical protein
VYGQLNDNGTIIGSPTTLLLAANLDTGAGSIGYSDTSTKNSTEFDFLFSTPLSSSNAKILADFDFGQGGIVLTTGGLNTIVNSQGYSGLDASFQNLSNGGQANTFVPEPAAFPMAASVMAFLGFAGVAIRRKPA